MPVAPRPNQTSLLLRIARRPGTALGSLVLAVALSVALVNPAVGVSWNAPVALTSTGQGWDGRLVTLMNSVAVAVYSPNGGVMVRRTADGGATWAPPLLLSATGEEPAISGRGSKVDALWREENEIRYARSTDAGISFGAPRTLASPTDGFVRDLSVARGPDGLVVVGWARWDPGLCEGDNWGHVRVKVSRDSGRSFSAADTLTTGSASGTAIAVGDGVIYVAFNQYDDDCESRIRVRRSLDAGKSWNAPSTLSGRVAFASDASITASGTDAYVAYQRQDVPSWPRYRRTRDKGATWSSAIDLGPPNGGFSNPVVSMKGGVVRAAMSKCIDLNELGECISTRAVYRESNNGTDWTAVVPVSIEPAAGKWPGASPNGVGYAGGRVIVLYHAWVYIEQPEGEFEIAQDVYVRMGS